MKFSFECDEEYGSLNPETALKMSLNFPCDEEYGSLN
jgi:hypothetical protein